jgi:hypothetical protein
MGRAIVMALGTVMAGIWMATPVLAEIESSVVDSLAYKSYHQRKPTLEKATTRLRRRA